MSKIQNTELFGLLSDTSEVTNAEMQNAYGSFTEHIKTVNRPENDPSDVFRALNVTRVERVILIRSQGVNLTGLSR